MSIKNKVGSPKKYNCDIKTITISLPVLAIPTIKNLIEIEKNKYLVNASCEYTADPNPAPNVKKLLY